MEETISKRLHVAGLTPNLTPGDLSKRLSTFGNVKAVDGFGLYDGFGQPRKYGFVTIETTRGRLARCMNSLNGSTWKGAKLRISEANPDFRERLAAERLIQIPSLPPKKKRKYGIGVHAPDMSLVTPENVSTRPGWKVTPLGRMVRPIRMRPERPLPPIPTREEMLAGGKKEKGANGMRKGKRRRNKEPDVRARRRTIDPTMWGSIHLKGMFIDVEVVGRGGDGAGVGGVYKEKEGDSGSRLEVEGVMKDAALAPSVPVISTLLTSTPITPQDDVDIATEKANTLDFLKSMFRNTDDDWVGRESVGSDIDEEGLANRQTIPLDGDEGEFEVVPQDSVITGAGQFVEETGMEDHSKKASTPPSIRSEQQATKLKDLFAPREDDAGFSLLGLLDLDLELDDEIPFPITAESIPTTSSPGNPATSVPTSYVPTVPPTLNPKQALFFPLSPSTTHMKVRPRDVFDIARENKWNWRDPAVGFFRTGTEEEIRNRWSEGKLELTRGWKRRWREAMKVRRRKGGGGMGEPGDE